MPSLGADMTEGTLVQWNVKPGDPVKRGDIIAIVGTEKADIEVEVYETGTVEKLIAQPGDKLASGHSDRVIQGAGEIPLAVAPPSDRARGKATRAPRESFARWRGSWRRNWVSILKRFKVRGPRA